MLDKRQRQIPRLRIVPTALSVIELDVGPQPDEEVTVNKNQAAADAKLLRQLIRVGIMSLTNVLMYLDDALKL